MLLAFTLFRYGFRYVTTIHANDRLGMLFYYYRPQQVTHSVYREIKSKISIRQKKENIYHQLEEHRLPTFSVRV